MDSEPSAVVRNGLSFAAETGEYRSPDQQEEISRFSKRVHILSEYLNRENLDGLWNKAKELRFIPDDIADKVCLVVVAGLKADQKKVDIYEIAMTEKQISQMQEAMNSL